MHNKPIGILDSGIGGLTVYNEIVQALPNESTVYIGDSRNTPYGAKSADQIYFLTKRLMTFLLKKDVKLIVIACNTITVSCIDRLRSEYPGLPIVGMVPLVKKAATVSHTKRIGILSTTQTAHSDSLKDLIEKFATDCKVFNHGTDTLVPLIEKGDFENPAIVSALHHALDKFSEEKIDTLALGCTHFPFLKKQMQQILGPSVQIIESGAAIARQVQRILTQNQVLSTNTKPTHDFYTTGTHNVMQKLIKSDVQTISL